MARSGKWVRCFTGGYALAARASEVQVESNFDELEASGFGEDKHYEVGQGDGSITIDGYFDEVTLLALQSGATAKIVTVAFGNNAAPTVGDPTFSMGSAQSSMEPAIPRDGLAAVKAKFVQKYPLDMGVLLADTTDTSADGNGTSVNNGAATTAGGVGYLHLTGVSASDTVQVAVQHSANNSTWADLIVFTIDGATVEAERIAVTGTVNQYIRAEWDVTGSDVAIDICVAFKRN